jgi:phenylalanyl-tRNA synthetase beta chain
MKYSYNWLKWYIPEAPDAEKMADIFTYHLAEVESLEKLPDGDTILEIKILPNRAHDLLSHQGLARELASLLDIPYVDPTPKYKIPESKPTDLKIEIKTKKDRRHMCRIVRNVKVGPSPEWVMKHLEAIGQRSINNIVDATNLVMFDCGQPLHAFDLNRVAGPKLIIRDSKSGEKITILTGEEKTLDDTMLLITDAEDHPLDTGIKGGKYAEITKDTTDVILEADNFDPVFARKTGQALQILTDARKRFENDLSPELIPYAMRELSALIMEMCPDARFEDIVDTYPQKQETKKLSFGTEKVSKVLGIQVSPAEIENIFKRYNFEYENNGGNFVLSVPPMRFDLTMEEDMAEEIGRILGYDKIKGNIPKIDFQPKQNELYATIAWARNKLLGEGYSEVMTTSFSAKGEVSVLASASDKNFLRTNLTDGLKESIKLNQANAPLLGAEQVKIFEIGTVFSAEEANIREEMMVAYGDKKEIKEMTLDEFLAEKLSPEEHKYFSDEKFLVWGSAPKQTTRSELSPAKTPKLFKMWPLFPFIARDVAVWVPENIKSSDVEKIIKDNMGEMVIKGPELFDEFKKNGKISYAFRIVFQSYERTLTDVEVNEIMDKINNRIKEKGWEVR